MLQWLHGKQQQQQQIFNRKHKTTALDTNRHLIQIDMSKTNTNINIHYLMIYPAQSRITVARIRISDGQSEVLKQFRSFKKTSSGPTAQEAA